MMMLTALLILLVVSLFAAALIGARLPKTHMAASRIRLRAPPEEVWRTVVDFESYPAWRPGLARVERGPDFDGLPSWFEICSRLGRVHFRVVENQPHRRLVTKIVDDQLPLNGLWLYEFEPAGNGTVLTITERESIHHPLLRFFDRFVISYYGVMDVYLIALAEKLGDAARPEHLSLRLDVPEAAG
jgi:uncharacterized protein YndB with AHSA1/START domain